MAKMANEIRIHSNRNEKKKLTHNVVKTAKSARKTRFIRDTEIPGFALRIEPTGAMSWTYQFRHKTNDYRDGKTRLYTIGSCNPHSADDTKSARSDIGTMQRHYLAVPDSYEAFNSIANGIAKQGDRS